jgi:hypothetical protein
VKHFSVVLGNPPYQAPKNISENNKSGIGGTSLWDKFVELSFKIVEKNGYISLIHPSKWRQPDELYTKMTKKQFLYLKMYDYTQGGKVFKCGTNFDWYIIKNADYKDSTIISDIDNKEHNINIKKEWPMFLPSGEYSKIKKLVNDKISDNIMCTSHYNHSFFFNKKTRKNIVFSLRAYEVRNTIYDRMGYPSNELSTEKTDWPIIYSVTNTEVNIFYAKKNKGVHFGVPKFIIHYQGNGQYKVNNFVNDYNGKYGMCQFCFGIKITSEEEGEKIRKWLKTEYKKISRYLKLQKNAYSYKIFELFNDNFWNIII